MDFSKRRAELRVKWVFGISGGLTISGWGVLIA
jgi:hypothetical protein